MSSIWSQESVSRGAGTSEGSTCRYGHRGLLLPCASSRRSFAASLTPHGAPYSSNRRSSRNLGYGVLGVIPGGPPALGSYLVKELVRFFIIGKVSERQPEGHPQQNVALLDVLGAQEATLSCLPLVHG